MHRLFKIFSICLSVYFLSMSTGLAFQFSNVISFGDSLSDLGNLPEASKPYIDPTKPKDLDNQLMNYYVPIANPVSTQDGFYAVPITKIFHLSHDPYEFQTFMVHNAIFLSKQPSIQGQPRLYRSMIWAEFFLADAYQDGYTRSQNLMPWVYLESNHYHANLNDSIDYAWASALSDENCYNPEWNFPSTQCDAQSVIDAWKKGQETSQEQAFLAVKVPALLAQEKIFLGDIKANKVQVGSSTVYTIWIGGNDLAHNFDILQHSTHVKEKVEALEKLVVTIAWNNYLGMRLLAGNNEVSAKHIYLFNNFNASLTPRIHSWPKALQDIGAVFVDIYNEDLKATVNWMHVAYPQTSVNLVSIYDWFEDMANGKDGYGLLGFKNNIGTACESTDLSYTGQPIPIQNCQGYMFWNAIHPAFPIEQMMGYLFEQRVAQTFNAPNVNYNLPQVTQAETLSQQKALLQQMTHEKVEKLLAYMDLS